VLIRELFGQKPEDYYMLIWTLPNKRSYWVQSVDEVDELREELAGQQNVYFGVGLVGEDYVEGLYNPQAKRCPQEKIAGIGGLWADIDVRTGDIHEQDNLPPSKEKAMELIESAPFEPSYIIDSGNGYQCWWLFEELWLLDNEGKRQEAKELVKSWTYTLRAIADDRFGWDIDCTIDLSRVMRLPGTKNMKNTPPKDVAFVEEEGVRYNRYSLQERTIDLDYIDDTSYQVDDAIEYEVGELVLDPQAEPPQGKWTALMQNQPKVAESFRQERDDIQDQSASGYDMSLANFAVQADWSDQEIVNLLIAHRRENNEDLKLRQDYYERTIKKARYKTAKEQSADSLDNVAHLAEKMKAEEGDVDELTSKEVRKHVLKHISNLMDIKIKRFVKYTSDPPKFKLETSKGSTIIGSGSSVLSQSTFRGKIFEATNTLVPKFKGEQWDKIVQALGVCLEEESIGDAATNKGTAKQWLEDYLNDRALMQWGLDDEEGIARSKNPFKKDDYIYIFGSDFRKWLRVSEMEKINAKEMGTILKSYGCQPERVNVTIAEENTTRSVWRLPAGFR